MKKLIYISILLVLVFMSSEVLAQTGGPGPPPNPPSGVPIDGISGLILMGLAAIFGKKFIKKDE